ncbi:DsbA family protein [Lichenifustis flavocetrariae]|uniref:Thioredoxin domain-containing protein n=1 Tax=Lichenifustis flavocetrariae TaxID=2949735 RepID=A0AA41Z1T9_9HYPH|nr:thioredoxin domain-containing protein [Lichenifustis flavocetrariae]MCW6511280.1 thioredoxin domain-containing protein [Lichenifustis flavocetrariae]
MPRPMAARAKSHAMAVMTLCGMLFACTLLHAETARPADPELSRTALLSDPATPSGGNPNGDVTVVEFFDYNCPVCVRTQPAFEAFLAADQGVRVVYKDWPIFGVGSVAAARVALAAQWQGRYATVHWALLHAPMRKVSVDQAMTIAVAAGADGPRLAADLAAHGPEIDAVLARTEKQADKLGLQGTPAFLIGPLLVEQPLDVAGFKAAAADARSRAGATIRMPADDAQRRDD